MSTPFQFPKPVRGSAPAQPKAARPPKPNVVKNGGGLNLNPSLNLSFVKANTTGSTAGQPGASTGSSPAGRGTPGSGFMSNEDIQQFSEHVRKQARNRAVERSLDAEQLEAVLRHIPTADGSMAGARLRSRRVSRHLKKIAKAEQAIAKAAAGMYAQFEREYEAELRKIKARAPQPTRFTF